MTATLLLIDLQRNMLEPPEPVPDAERLIPVITDLLVRARASGATVIHVRNNGDEGELDFPGTPGWELHHALVEGEAIVDKFAMDAFEGTVLAELIPAGSPVVTAGLASEYCVRATVLSGLRQGYAMRLVRGAHATYDEGGRSADEIAAAVETELAVAGAELVDPNRPLFT